MSAPREIPAVPAPLETLWWALVWTAAIDACALAFRLAFWWAS